MNDEHFGEISVSLYLQYRAILKNMQGDFENIYENNMKNDKLLLYFLI